MILIKITKRVSRFFVDLTSGSDESDYKMKIYKNNKKVGSITYKKKGEGSDE
jgi:hypothetical protein